MEKKDTNTNTSGDDGGWECRHSRYLFESPWFRLRQDDITLPGGEQITYSLVDHPGYVVVVPLLDDGRVVMERVYRYTVQATLLECPSGGLDGEDPVVAALWELEEETGWVGSECSYLGSFYGGTGSSNERFYVVLVRGLARTGTINREPTEQMEIDLMEFGHVVELASTGQIQDAPSAFALLRAQRFLAMDPG